MSTLTEISDKERIAHVARRLGMGANPDLIEKAIDVDDAISLSLQKADEARPPELVMPTNWDLAYEDEYAPINKVGMWWVEQMIANRSPIKERLTWFWHDHFATSAEKADVGWVVWHQIKTLRKHAMGNFGDLMKAIARDPAMLWYLDNQDNTVSDLNENYGREALELHTLGVGNYSQADVIAAARGFTGWHVNYPDDENGGFETDEVPGWAAYFHPEDYDREPKALLGKRGQWDMDLTIDIMLEHPATAKRTASKLYKALTGLAPDDKTATRLGIQFANTWGYEIMPLVEEIIASDAFLSNEAVGSMIRTPLEKVVTMFQAFPLDIEDADFQDYWWNMVETGYYPYGVRNPAGYDKGEVLLSPTNMVKVFDMLWPLQQPEDDWDTEYVSKRLGLFNLSRLSRNVLDLAPNSGYRVALAFASPEFATT